MSAEGVPPWRMTGALVGACNCDWGCPCNFDAPPTFGACEGVYAFVVRDGMFGDVPLGGSVFVMGGRSPGAIHEGDNTSFLILDEGMTDAQRAAIVRLWLGGGVGSPFDEFASVTTVRYDPRVLPIDVELSGIRSRVRVAGGGTFELALDRVRNPVSGEDEITFLDKPTGFTSKRSELGASTVHRLVTEHLSYDHSGKYAEFAEFSYAGP